MKGYMLPGSNYRLYTFVNFYLSSIQQGIQSAHIVSNLFVKYSRDTLENDYDVANDALWHWAEHDKTMIVLNGGTAFDIRQNYIEVTALASKCDVFAIPFTFFQEDHNALGIYEHGVVTGFGMVVPQEMWGATEYPLDQNKLNVTGDYFPFATSYVYENIVNDKKSYVSFLVESPESKLISLIKKHSLAR
jgi:hypothetical protein